MGGYNFPYLLMRPDVRELEVGGYINVGGTMGVIVAKNHFPVLQQFTIAASSTLTVQFTDSDSNLNATSGTITIKGYVGSTQKSPHVVVQIKYIAFTTGQNVTMKWGGTDPFPLYANVNYNSVLNSPGDESLSQGLASPLVFNRFSSDPSLFLQAVMDNTSNTFTGGQSYQNIVLDVIEYLWTELAAKQSAPTVYDAVDNRGYLFHVDGTHPLPNPVQLRR